MVRVKPTRALETLANIRVNLVAFVSIAMFVGLGIAVFLGIRWGGEAMRLGVHSAMDAGSAHDIEVAFPYGLTDDDLARLRETEGVSDVEGGYSAFATIAGTSGDIVIRLQSLTERMDRATVTEGRLPEADDEVALVRHWANRAGIAVGDTIELKRGQGTTGADCMRSGRLKVVGLVQHPSYLGVNNGALGISPTTSGSVECVGLTTKGAFDPDKLFGAYTNAYIRCDSLAALNTFHDDYVAGVRQVADRVSALSAERATARYDKVYGESREKAEDARRQLDDGASALDELRETLSSGERDLAAGRSELARGEAALLDARLTLADTRAVGAEQLADAYRTLLSSQYDLESAGAALEKQQAAFDAQVAGFDDMRPYYDAMMVGYNEASSRMDALEGRLSDFDAALGAWRDAPAAEKDAQWGQVTARYQEFFVEYANVCTAEAVMSASAWIVSSALGAPLDIPSPPELPYPIAPEGAEATAQSARGAVGTAREAIGVVGSASVTVEGETVPMIGIPEALDRMGGTLLSAREQLDAARTQLSEGWALYHERKAALDAGTADGASQVAEGQATLDSLRGQLADGAERIQEGRKALDEKGGELERARPDVEAAERSLSKMERFDWAVLTRNEGPCAIPVFTMAKMIDSACWAMALLFVLVGLFVCYSAVARLVHEQVVQIGTKKALGFTAREVSHGYLLFSGIAVAAGLAIGAVLSVVLVQTIMNPSVNRQFDIGTYPPFFSLLEFVAMGAVELALILASTQFAIRGVLRREAVELLAGGPQGSAHGRFYERWAIWSKMSLYAQTIVNNLVNDKRRVIGTLVGIVGCTGLIVTALTLSDDVARSLASHYEGVYSFDTIVCCDVAEGEAPKEIENALFEQGLAGTPVYRRGMQVRKSDGGRGFATVYVPMNESVFDRFYRVRSHGDGEGGGRSADDGLWVCAGFAEHNGIAVGDTVELLEATGKSRELKVAGIYDSYLMRNEFVLSASAYREAFGSEARTNCFLTDREGQDVAQLQGALSGVKGFQSIEDDRGLAEYGFGQMKSLLDTVVKVYLLLSALMAFMVLLNLYNMFVSEKKRELIVLMICGYSVREAKAYIYRDSIALTVLGIVVGIVFGSFMGSIATQALEPEVAFFLKDFSLMAAVVGAVATFAFSMGVLLMSLRRIPRFDLTDINRF